MFLCLGSAVAPIIQEKLKVFWIKFMIKQRGLRKRVRWYFENSVNVPSVTALLVQKMNLKYKVIHKSFMNSK